MIIDLYCVGSCRDNGKPTQQASCGLVLQVRGADYAKFREFTYGLGNATANLADIQAVRLAVLSIGNKFKKERIVAHTPSRYVAGLFARGDVGWVSEPSKNVEVIQEVRRLLDECKATVVIDTSAVKQMGRARELARQTLDTQKFTDSFTQNMRLSDA